MIPTSLSQLAEYCGGRVHGDPDIVVTAPADIDSRSVRPGGLFIALSGQNVDGHDYAAAAFDAGAVAVLSSRPIDGPCVVVDDVIRALGMIAAEVVNRLEEIRIIAVTGSVGKTTVKDLLARLLSTLGPVVAAQGSFNNELGVPLTALRATAETRYLVVEMGARGIGHIAQLCAITPPDISVVLNVGSAHLSEFGSAEAIAQAKGELVQALGLTGVAVLNDDDRNVRAMAAECRGRVVTFGRHGDVAFGDVVLNEVGHVEMELRSDGQSHHLGVPIIGEHHAANVAAAAAVAIVEGCALGELTETLSHARPDSPMRLARKVTASGVVVLDDSYNANPESVEAGLRALTWIARPQGRQHGSAVAVLGQMLELGESSESAHKGIGLLCRELSVDKVLVIGQEAAPIAHGAGNIATVLEGVDEAVTMLKQLVRAGDVVLIKASRGARLERVANALLDDTRHTT